MKRQKLDEPPLPLDLPEYDAGRPRNDLVSSDEAVEIIPPAKFDYNQYDAGVATEIRDAANRIRSRGKAQTEAIADIGAALLAVKEKVCHGS